MLSADEKLAMVMIALGFFGFPLLCWLMCLWADYHQDDVGRACRRADRKYYEWEQRQKRKRRRRR